MEYEPRTMGREIEYGVQVVRGGNLYDGGESLNQLKYLAEIVVNNYRPRDVAVSQSYLGNGGRLYLDLNAHPEYSGAETTSLLELAAGGVVGDKLMLQTFQNAATDDFFPGEQRFLDRFQLFKSVRTGDSAWGCHENYEISRTLAGLDGSRGRHLSSAKLGPAVGFMAIRPLVAGIGYVDTERGMFLLAQKASVVNCDTHTDTIRAKPLINMRDRSFGHDDLVARLHVTGCDPASPHVTVRSMGTMSLMLRLMEIDAERRLGYRYHEDRLAPHWKAVDGWHSVARGISNDFFMEQAYDINLDGRTRSMTALDMHEVAIQKMGFLVSNELASAEESWAFEDYESIVAALKSVIDASKAYKDRRERYAFLKTEYMGLRSRLDWADRLHLLDADVQAKPDAYAGHENLYKTNRARVVNEMYDLVGTQNGPSLVMKRASRTEAQRWAPSDLVRERLQYAPDGRARLRGDFVRLMALDKTTFVSWNSLRFSMPSAVVDQPADQHYLPLLDSKAEPNGRYNRFMELAASKRQADNSAA